jgi:hypothetical protein
MKTFKLLSFLMLGMIVFSSMTMDQQKATLTGRYYWNGMGTGSFIEFKTGGVVQSGNVKTGVVNCLTIGKFTVSGTKVTLSDLYNENCSSIEDRNGVYLIEGAKAIRKEGASYQWMK